MPDGSGLQAGPGQMAVPVLMNHTAGSRSPAELNTGGGEECGGGGGGTSTMASGTV